MGVVNGIPNDRATQNHDQPHHQTVDADEENLCSSTTQQHD